MESNGLAVLFTLLAILTDFAACDRYCPYYDSFNQIRHRWCENQCCGNIHQAHCCLEKEVGQIVFGSVGGLVLLTAVVLAAIVLCLRYDICCRRGDNIERLLPTETDRTKRAAARTPYGTTDSTPVATTELSVTITPPSPNDKSYRIISRPEPTFGSFQPGETPVEP